MGCADWFRKFKKRPMIVFLLKEWMDAMTKKTMTTHLTRRDFLITLGGIAGAAVVGWIASPKSVELVSKITSPAAFPELLDCLQVRNGDDGTEVYDASDKSNPTLVCKVNETGGSILRQLDGRHSMMQIIQTTTESIGEKPSNPDLFASKIALFIVKLAEAGFIKQPFYINVIENTFVS
jgi:hypothetical protein